MAELTAKHRQEAIAIREAQEREHREWNDAHPWAWVAAELQDMGYWELVEKLGDDRLRQIAEWVGLCPTEREADHVS